jgi:hypothetical protein
VEDTRLIVWQRDWRAFDAPEKEADFLRELCSETGEANPRHPLHGKECRIVGWRMPPFQSLPETASRLPGWKDFILHLPAENRFAFVHLTWNKETDPRYPTCQFFGSTDAVNTFIRRKWGQEK